MPALSIIPQEYIASALATCGSHTPEDGDGKSDGGGSFDVQGQVIQDVACIAVDLCVMLGMQVRPAQTGDGCCQG